MGNKSLGSSFERDFGELLSKSGYWVHILQDNRNGQPFDVIAAKNNITRVFDCKVCSDGFRLSRMEPNQISAMQLWESCGNQEGAFAIKALKAGTVYIIPFRSLLNIRNSGVKFLNIDQIRKLSLEEYVYGTDHQQ